MTIATSRVLAAALLGACAPNGTTPAPAQPQPTNAGVFREPTPRVPVHDWVVLSGVTATANTAQDIPVGAGEAFSQLLVKAIAGEPEIEQMEIYFANDESRLIKLDHKLVAGDGQVIELREKRAIKRIIVYTDPDSQGTYTIYGA
jgi:hypothetical protein